MSKKKSIKYLPRSKVYQRNNEVHHTSQKIVQCTVCKTNIIRHAVDQHYKQKHNNAIKKTQKFKILLKFENKLIWAYANSMKRNKSKTIRNAKDKQKDDDINQQKPVKLTRVSKPFPKRIRTAIYGYCRQISSQLFYPISCDTIKIIINFFPNPKLVAYGIGELNYEIGELNYENYCRKLNLTLELTGYNLNHIYQTDVLFGNSATWMLHENKRQIYFSGIFDGICPYTSKHNNTLQEIGEIPSLLQDDECIKFCSNGLNQSYLLFVSNKNRVFCSPYYYSKGYDLVPGEYENYSIHPYKKWCYVEPISKLFAINRIKVMKIENNSHQCYFLGQSGKIFYVGFPHVKDLNYLKSHKIQTPEIVPNMFDKITVDMATCVTTAVFRTQNGSLFQIGARPLNISSSDWNCNDYGRVFKATKIAELNNMNIIDVKCGLVHSLCLNDKHQCYSWGNDSHGQLGIGKSTKSRSDVFLIKSLDGLVQSIYAGNKHSAVLTVDNKLYTWGMNLSRQCHPKYACTSSKLYVPRLLSRKYITEKGINASSRIVDVIAGRRSTIIIVSQ